MKLHLIDAFAEAPFTGNPAAVVLLDTVQPDEWMQRVAMEMNQAETAFLSRLDDGFSLRWFTPVAEVELCGHATLASAHFLWETAHLPAGHTARFHTRSGLLSAVREHDGAITLDFPAIVSRPAPAPPGLDAALGVRPTVTLRGDFDLLCVVPDAAIVRRLTPDLAAVSRWGIRGLIVTAVSDLPGVDFVSRCFFPNLGIAEDPVTGSAHCALAPYWREVLGRDELVGFQASPRGGTVRCAVRGDRITLSGRAVTTLKGDWLV